MSVWIRRGAIVLALLLLVAGGAYYWLIAESHVPGGGERFSVDLAEVRRLADSLPGEKPKAIGVEQIAVFHFPAAAVMAGDGWTRHELPVFSYQLVYPERTVVIDTAMDEKITTQGGGTGFDSGAYARMSKALEQASLILITHEHVDHIGGLTAQPALPNMLKSLRLTREQVDHPDRMVPASFPSETLSSYQPLQYDRYLAIAPGVVLIKSPGHTPGSQMIFVRKADGTEILFLGDVAWQMQNVDNVRERARLVTWYFLKEDRSSVFRELVELHRLKEAEPRVHMVPGHDGAAVASLVEQQIFTRGFR